MSQINPATRLITLQPLGNDFKQEGIYDAMSVGMDLRVRTINGMSGKAGARPMI